MVNLMNLFAVFFQLEMQQIDYADAFDTALEDLIDDLKNIMNKDLCKRMVTQSAFKFFENWWHREEDNTKVPVNPFPCQDMT